MRVTVTALALAAGLSALSVSSGFLAQAPSSFVGKWEITGTGPDAKAIFFLDVVDKGDHLEAKFLDRSAHATPVPWIRVENGELVWQKGNALDTLPKPSCGPVYRAKLEGGKLIGSHVEPGEPCPSNRAGGAGAGAARGEGRGGAAPAPAANPTAAATPAPVAAPAPAKAPPTPRTLNWVGVRQPSFPAANANGNHTYGKAVVIVGPGVGKDTWSGLTPETWQNRCEDRWTVTDGTLKNEVAPQGQTPTCNIYTKDTWQDFKAEMDFVLDLNQNSGFYLRGRHELQLQVMNDPAQWGQSTYPGQLMDIYGWKRADVYAGNPAGELQQLSVVMVANKLTATLNGKKVHDNATVYAWTGGALDNKEDTPGPIMIQGDHSRVTVKKLVVTPITKAGM